MNQPKTIKGYVALMRRIELMHPSFCGDFERQDEDVKAELCELSAAISNIVNDIEDSDLV